jgi:hypothetical protein
MRGERKPIAMRVTKLDEVYEAVISSNVADEALKVLLGSQA